MFLGYQNEKIVLVAQTREALENAPCIVLDEIKETDKEYELYKGEYLLKEVIEDMEASKQKEARIEELKELLSSTDWYAIRYADSGVEIPEEIKEKRQAARLKIDEIRAELEQLEDNPL